MVKKAEYTIDGIKVTDGKDEISMKVIKDKDGKKYLRYHLLKEMVIIKCVITGLIDLKDDADDSSAVNKKYVETYVTNKLKTLSGMVELLKTLKEIVI